MSFCISLINKSMFELITLFTLLIIAQGGLAKVLSLDGKIVGGVDANIEDYPYQVSLEYLGSHVCGGSIIAPKKILTAAHCTHSHTASNARVRISTSLIHYGGEQIQVRSFCEHPSYNTWNHDNDVAVILLSSAIKYGIRSQPIKLIAGGISIPIGADGVATGWGYTTEGGSLSTHLKKVTVSRLNDNVCIEKYTSAKFTSNMLCYGYLNGEKDTCQGDSGGPLVADNVQIGIVSWGYGCGRPQKPGVYTKLSLYQNFIRTC